MSEADYKRDDYRPSERRERSGRRAPALTVIVGDRGIDQALRIFKKLVIKEGLLKDLKRREHYEKPGDRKRRKMREAVRRRRRQAARSRGRMSDRD